MTALEEYRDIVSRIGKEYQPADWNDGATSVKTVADAAIAELKKDAAKWEWVARHELNMYHNEYAPKNIEAEVNICEEREDWEVDELLAKYEEEQQHG